MTIGLIDDEEVFHWIAKQFLERVDRTVQTVSFYNGKEALDFLSANEEAPEIILVDLNMPVANGWEFLDRYHALNTTSDSRIFVVSSSIDPNDMKRARSYEHVEDFIPKPITTEFLEKLLAVKTDS